MAKLLKYLKGGDLRSIAYVDKVVSSIKSQSDFNKLFYHLFSKDRLIVMRTVDAIEKITLQKPQYLTEHKHVIIKLMETAHNKELKWHLALLASRFDLTIEELNTIWDILTSWATDKKESRIVRVNSIQSLFNLTNEYVELKNQFNMMIKEIELENIPSINSRLKTLKIK